MAKFFMFAKYIFAIPNWKCFHMIIFYAIRKFNRPAHFYDSTTVHCWWFGELPTPRRSEIYHYPIPFIAKSHQNLLSSTKTTCKIIQNHAWYNQVQCWQTYKKCYKDNENTWKTLGNKSSFIFTLVFSRPASVPLYSF